MASSWALFDTSLILRAASFWSRYFSSKNLCCCAAKSSSCCSCMFSTILLNYVMYIHKKMLWFASSILLTLSISCCIDALLRENSFREFNSFCSLPICKKISRWFCLSLARYCTCCNCAAAVSSKLWICSPYSSLICSFSLLASSRTLFNSASSWAVRSSLAAPSRRKKAITSTVSFSV